VEKGFQIAEIGSSGRSTGPHVHFEVLKNDRQVNPMQFISASK
jgi:murein DD-endopeptidase MepM/ murein hydrolase activator NlpD